jgi:hypothetical protein
MLYIPQCVNAGATSYSTTAKLRVQGVARVHDSSGDYNVVLVSKVVLLSWK